MLKALDRLEGETRSLEAEEPEALRRGLAALDAFFAFFQGRVVPHMALEEREVYPLLDRLLPSEVCSAQAMLQEHETAASLVALLRRGRSRLTQGSPDAGAEVVTLVQDLALLLRDHIRKEDDVINPLLGQLLRGGRRVSAKGRAAAHGPRRGREAKAR